MVARSDHDEEEQSTDIVGIVVSLVFWAALAWLAWDVGQVLLARQQMVRDVNEAIELLNTEKPGRARALIVDVQQRRQTIMTKPGEKFLNMVGVRLPSFGEQIAGIYREAAADYYQQQENLLCIRSSQLALTHDPHTTGLGEALSTSAYYEAYWELALYGAQLGVEEGMGNAPKLVSDLKSKVSAEWAHQ